MFPEMPFCNPPKDPFFTTVSSLKTTHYFTDLCGLFWVSLSRSDLPHRQNRRPTNLSPLPLFSLSHFSPLLFGFSSGPMKKMKAVASMAPPPFADPTTRFKHHSQDYHELKKETEGVKETLERAKQKKLTLLAEVRFLRRRHKYLVKKQSLNPQPKRDLVQTQKPEVHSRNNVKRRNYSAKEATLQHPVPGMDLNQQGKSCNVKEASLRHPGSGFDLNQGKFNCGKDAALRNNPSAIDLNMKDRTYSGKEAAMRNTTLVFDLNQISREEEEELNGGPLRFEEPRKSSIRIANEEQQNDMKLSICRNVGSGTSRAGKRKITWQDPVALRV